jgi:hypothetical protein
MDVLLETRKAVVRILKQLLREELLHLKRQGALLARVLLESILLVLHV